MAEISFTLDAQIPLPSSAIIYNAILWIEKQVSLARNIRT